MSFFLWGRFTGRCMLCGTVASCVQHMWYSFSLHRKLCGTVSFVILKFGVIYFFLSAWSMLLLCKHRSSSENLLTVPTIPRKKNNYTLLIR
ncbi:hypothetical protein XENTR_v10021288 [Xenopus tropicalis]|nr:hypothetical protein XENTR_v10021288 [Xenopus tropicalis]